MYFNVCYACFRLLNIVTAPYKCLMTVLLVNISIILAILVIYVALWSKTNIVKEKQTLKYRVFEMVLEQKLLSKMLFIFNFSY